MEVVLGFLFAVFLSSMRPVRRASATRRDGVLLVACIIVALSLLSHRVA